MRSSTARCWASRRRASMAIRAPEADQTTIASRQESTRLTSFHGIVVRRNHRRPVRTSGRASSQVTAVAAAMARVSTAQATSRPRMRRRAGSAAASATRPDAGQRERRRPRPRVVDAQGRVHEGDPHRARGPARPRRRGAPMAASAPSQRRRGFTGGFYGAVRRTGPNARSTAASTCAPSRRRRAGAAARPPRSRCGRAGATRGAGSGGCRAPWPRRGARPRRRA